MIWKKTIDYQSKIFVSIGAGINQIPLIHEAKKLGLQIVGVDQSTHAAGISECDIRIHESIDNYEEIYRKLRELLLDGEIMGVLSKSYGSAIKTSSYIANMLNIPQISFERIDDFIDKKRMKTVLKKNNIKSPNFSIFNRNGSPKKISRSYPFVIKPIKGHAKIDVELIKDQNDFDEYFQKTKSKNGSYLIEKYIEGEEIITVGIVHKGTFHLVDITDKVALPPHFVDLMHIAPSKYSHLWEKIQDIGQNIADSFEISTSPMIMELMITPDEDIYIIEAAPEFGGEFLSDILIPARTGYNVLRESILAVMGKEFTPPIRRKTQSAIVVKYITGQKGKLMSFNPHRASRSSGVIFSRVFKDIGSKVNVPVTNLDRLGVIITRGKTREEAIEAAEKSQGKMNIRISS